MTNPGPDARNAGQRRSRSAAGARADRDLQPQLLRGDPRGSRAQEILAGKKLPPRLVGKDIWKHRFEDIRAWERYLARNGVLILKFFLHVSREEQRRRFLARLDEPDKHWKHSSHDVRERAFWSEYLDAYEDAIRNTAAPHAPWYAVPADHKWFTRLVVAVAVIDGLGFLELAYPSVDATRRRELAEARKALTAGD